jgi:O-antigen/teichoic acid export membrane protein
MNIEIAKSVARNTSIQFVQQIITWASTFFLMLFLPRYLGPVDYGRLFLAISITSIFLVAIDYDGRLGIAKRVARNPSGGGQILVDSMIIRIVIWIISVFMLFVFCLIVDYPNIVKSLILIFAIEMIWRGGRTVLNGVFLGYEIVQYSAIGYIAERLFISVLGVVALLLGANSVIIAIIMSLSTLCSYLITQRYVKKVIPNLPKADFKGSLVLLKDGVPFLLWTIFGVIYYTIDSIMLSFMAPEPVLGWYGASYKFFTMLAFLPSIYSTTIMPVLSKLWGKDDNLLARTTQKSVQFMFIGGIPISIAMFALSKYIIQFFFGLENYTPSILNLRIFSTGLLLIYIDMILGTAIMAINKHRQWATVAFIAVFVNIGLNSFMIPYTQANYNNGGIGAAVATIITEFFILASALHILPKSIFEKSLNQLVFKTLIAGVILFLCFYILEKISIFWVVQLVIGLVIYTISLFLLKVFTTAEISFFRSSFSFKNIKSVLLMKKRGG